MDEHDETRHSGDEESNREQLCGKFGPEQPDSQDDPDRQHKAQDGGANSASAGGGDAVALARAAFAAELAHRRLAQRLSQQKLAGAMGFDPSYISHLESGRHAPTEDVARLAEQILDAGQAIWNRWLDYAAARARARPPRPMPPPPPPSTAKLAEGRSTAPEVGQDPAEGGSQASAGQGIDLRGAQFVQTGAGSQQYNYISPTTCVSWPLRVGAVPTLATAFQPRTAVRQAVDAARTGHTTIVLAQVLTGGGGVGKSQLAASYAAQALTDRTDLVIWANATETEQVIDLYAQAARRIQAPGTTGDHAENDARAFLDWLATTPRTWLIVLDDITDPQTLGPWWPAPSPHGNGHVLATTRRREAALSGGGRAVIEVDTYTPAEANAYLETRLTEADAAHLLDPQASAVADELGRLPLALSHAAAYMINEDVTCTDYLQRLTDHQSHLTDLLPEEADTESYGRQVTAALLLALDAAQRCKPTGLALPAMRLAAYLDPAGHPQTLWTTTSITHYLTTHRTPDPNSYKAQDHSEHGREVSPAQARAALRLLHRYALITCDPTNGPRAVRIHALTARATRETTPTTHTTATARAIADALYATWPEHDHIDSELCAVLRASTDTLATYSGDLLWHHEAPKALLRAGNSLLGTGLYTAAITHWQRLTADSERLLGPTHADTLQSHDGLAVSYREAGRIDEAIPIQERVVAERERILGPEHPNTLRSRGNLAASYRAAGRIDEATSAHERVAAEQERILNPEHPDTLQSLNNLALCYWEVGRIDEAISINERVVAERERILGPEHPDTLVSWSNLALCYRQAGRIDEAISINERVVAERERILGPEHPDTLVSWSNLAVSYFDVGRIDEVLSIEERVVAERERILGPQHIETFRSWNNLAACYRQAGRIDEAISINERVVAERERILGPEHPDTLQSLNNLALCYRQAGRIDEAISINERVVAERERNPGPEHPGTLQSWINLAFCYFDVGRIDEVLSIEERVVAERERILGPEHPDTLQSLNNLAVSYREVGRIDEATSAHERVAAEQERILGPGHPDTLRSWSNLALCYQQVGRTVEAVAFMERAVAERTRLFGPQHADTIKSVELLRKWTREPPY
ncbi:tetratricopeptide repeat protein [Streptomyces sp. NEAU-174]|uniref:tetratricopeptide repeat protein n=1 Tax=Streptomyces sp. NEAU-174 TaxID=3458254 RepID=UPI004043F774